MVEFKNPDEKDETKEIRMIDTDDLDNMSRRDLVELLEAYNESLAEVERLGKLLNRISDVVEEGLCYSDEWWATDDYDEQEKLPFGGLKIADSGVDDWPNVHFCSKKIQELRGLLP